MGIPALLALFDAHADPDSRIDGAHLLWGLAYDIHLMRIAYVKEK